MAVKVVDKTKIPKAATAAFLNIAIKMTTGAKCGRHKKNKVISQPYHEIFPPNLDKAIALTAFHYLKHRHLTGCADLCIFVADAHEAHGVAEARADRVCPRLKLGARPLEAVIAALEYTQSPVTTATTGSARGVCM